MKKSKHENLRLTGSFLILFFLLIVNAGCKKSSDAVATNSQTSDALRTESSTSHLDGFKTVILNSNKSSYGGLHINPRLLNAWGMSASDEGEIWVSAADGGVSFVYDKTGAQTKSPIHIPSHDANTPGNPTGNLYNGTTDFIIPGTNTPSEFIFASEDGTISAWNDPTGTSAKVVADRSGKGASYKGITLATDYGANFLYATNFAKFKIDVFDKEFKYVTGKPFTDPNLPAGYAPFNIYNVDGMLYVTYALKNADGDDSTGAGLGIVNIFKPDGSMVKRFASYATLNAPWGIADVSGTFCGVENPILIGNFGDGRINVFDQNGNFKGQLKNGGYPVAIEGLWSINAEIPGANSNQLYFTAGPNEETDGLFGFLLKK